MYKSELFKRCNHKREPCRVRKNGGRGEEGWRTEGGQGKDGRELKIQIKLVTCIFSLMLTFTPMYPVTSNMTCEEEVDTGAYQS